MVITDNMCLLKAVNRETHEANSFSQDGGDVFAELLSIKKYIKTKIEVIHYMVHKRKPKKYEDDPITHLMCECDEKSRSIREGITNNVDPIILKEKLLHAILNNEYVDHRAVQ